MSLTKFTKDMGIISALDDEPNDVTGLSANELKAKFDEGGQALKEYINDTLTEEIPQAIDDAVTQAGNMPMGGLVNQVLAKRTNTDYDYEWQDGLPIGGNPGDFLVKNSVTDRDTKWATVGDYIVEVGQEIVPYGGKNYPWRYEKWASGRYVCTAVSSSQGDTFNIQEGSVYRKGSSTWYFPAALLTITNVQATVSCATTPMLWATVYSTNTSTNAIVFDIFRPTSGTVSQAPYYLYLRLEGTWK